MASHRYVLLFRGEGARGHERGAGGVDAIVFTGGIGENDAQVRTLICGRLAVIGVRLNTARNRDACNPISNGASRCQVRVAPSPEDEQIARHAGTLY